MCCLYDSNVLIIVIILFLKWTLGFGKDIASKFYHVFFKGICKNYIHDINYIYEDTDKKN